MPIILYLVHILQHSILSIPYASIVLVLGHDEYQLIHHPIPTIVLFGPGNNNTDYSYLLFSLTSLN